MVVLPRDALPRTFEGVTAVTDVGAAIAGPECEMQDCQQFGARYCSVPATDDAAQLVGPIEGCLLPVGGV